MRTRDLSEDIPGGRAAGAHRGHLLGATTRQASEKTAPVGGGGRRSDAERGAAVSNRMLSRRMARLIAIRMTAWFTSAAVRHAQQAVAQRTQEYAGSPRSGSCRTAARRSCRTEVSRSRSARGPTSPRMSSPNMAGMSRASRRPKSETTKLPCMPRTSRIDCSASESCAGRVKARSPASGGRARPGCGRGGRRRRHRSPRAISSCASANLASRLRKPSRPRNSPMRSAI